MKIISYYIFKIHVSLHLILFLTNLSSRWIDPVNHQKRDRLNQTWYSVKIKQRTNFNVKGAQQIKREPISFIDKLKLS